MRRTRPQPPPSQTWARTLASRCWENQPSPPCCPDAPCDWPPPATAETCPRLSTNHTNGARNLFRFDTFNPVASQHKRDRVEIRGGGGTLPASTGVCLQNDLIWPAAPRRQKAGLRFSAGAEGFCPL